MKITHYIETNFNKLFWLVSAVVFVLIVLRAFFIPFSHDEVNTFFTYVQPNDYLPYKAHIYTNNHVLNSALANLCYHMAGSHRFVLRLPNILSFIILCLGVFKHFKYLKTIYAKIILVTFFILTLNFLDFFELCRGYGLSFAFIVLGLAYLADYFQDKKIKSFMLFSLFLQLALAANLILAVLLTVLLFCILVFQIKNRLLFRPTSIIIQLLNIVILIFWIKFSVFYKKHGALDVGFGDNYWEVTFKTLMLFLFGANAIWLQVLTLVIFAAILLFAGKTFFQSPASINKIFTPNLFYILILSILIIAFYVQKKLLNVNFPQDRTGMFLYLLFIISFSFFINQLSNRISGVITLVLLVTSITFFLFNYNISNFSFYCYQTIPQSIYNTLVSESSKAKEVITIGGIQELNYAFLNYRNNSALNSMNYSDYDQMTMNCDYYFISTREKPYYKDYYEEIAFDNKWGRALLKRKEKIERHLLYNLPYTSKNYNGNNEFYGFAQLNDSVLKARNCIEVELEVKFNKVPTPLLAHIVVQINNNKGEGIYFKRVVLNWLTDDLNGKTKKIKLTIGQLPEKNTDLLVYLWNIKYSDIDFTINELKILELKGKGVNVTIPKSFYKYLEETGYNSFL